MTHRRFFALSLLVLCIQSSVVYAEGADAQWKRLNQQALDLYQAGNYKQAIIVAQHALALAEANVGPDHPAVANSLNNLALLYKIQGNYAQAEPLYQRSLAIWEKTLGPNHPNVATSLENLAILYRATQRTVEAEALEQRAAKIRAIKR